MMKLIPYIECRLAGDGFMGNYSVGQSMIGGETSQKIAEAMKLADRVKECMETDDNQSPKSSTDRKIAIDNSEFMLNSCVTGEATRYSTTIKNISKDTISIEMISSFAVKGLEFDKIYRLQSYWSAEGQLKVDTIESLHLNPSWMGMGLRSEKFFNLGSMPVRKFFPFIALENTKTGECMGVLLSCATSWQMELISLNSEYSLNCGLADYDTGHFMKNLAPGESFTTPEAIVATGSSLYDVCDKLVKAQQPDISPIDNKMGILFNEYCTTWGNPSEENVKNIIQAIRGKGFQYLVIDCGWYKKTEHWYQDQGDWELNKTQFPNGIQVVADAIRKAGMIPGIWFEFEAAGPGADAFRYDEHLIHRNGKTFIADGRKFLDMTDPWVIDYLSERVITFLKENHFGYIKIDYNGTIGLGCDGAESLGEGMRRQMEGVKAFYRKIKEEIPEMVIEVCSSGGHRLVPDFLELASQASFSDAHETLYMPCIAANLHRVVRPDQSQIWAVVRKEDSISRIQYSIINTFLGRMCLSGDIYDMNEAQWAEVERGMTFYNKISDLIQYGKTTLIQNEVVDLTHPQGNQLVIREYDGRKLVIFHRFEHSSNIREFCHPAEKCTDDNASFLPNGMIIDSYGEANCDFTAQAWIIK